MALQPFNGGSSSYAGEHSAMYVNAAFQASPTLKNQTVKIMPGIKFRETLQDFSAADVIDQSNCSSGDALDGFNLSVNEVQIEPREFQTVLNLCKQTFHTDWQSKYQMMSAHDNIPNKFEDYLLGYVGGLVGAELETLIWKGQLAAGANAINGKFDGFTTIAQANADVVDVALEADNIRPLDGATANSNIDTEFAKQVAGIPNRVWSNGPSGLAHYVGSSVYRAYVARKGAVNNGIKDYQTTWWGGDFQGLTYDGIPLIYAPGLDSTTGATTDFIITTYRDNLIFGTGLMSDMTYADVIDRSRYDGSRNVLVVFRYTAGVQIVNGEDLVLGTFA